MSIIKQFMGFAGSSATSDYYDPLSGDITFTDTHFQYGIPGVSKTGFTMRNTLAFVEFRTSLTDFFVKVGGNWSVATTGDAAQSSVFLYVNDVYNQQITLNSNDTTETYAITSLAVGVKNIKIYNGYSAQSDAGGDINLPQAGVYLQGVVTSGNIEIKKYVAPTKKIVVEGMSITSGASSLHGPVTGWAHRFRLLDGYKMTFVSYGAKGLANNSGVFGSTQATAMVNFHASLMDGTSQNELWMDLATNDFALSGWRFSASTWQTHVALYADTFHSTVPAGKLIWILPTDRSDYDTPNTNGATLGDYVTAINTVASTRSAWMKVMGDRTDVSLSNMTDGLHPNDTGHGQRYTNIKPQYLGL